MEIYSVGGAVRDQLLKLAVQDRDYVVIGATEDEMRARGFLPVGRDFPVFLHPETHEEYALARTERKTGPGYRGFEFHADPAVTLEQDLGRRDLTINAMAQDAEGQIVDPFGGLEDLKARVLRHVGAAFVEDPVRILRVARFAARFTDFSIAPATLKLMKEMVDAGEVDALVPERVWQELSRGLMETRPSRMLRVLSECKALERVAPELGDVTANTWEALDASAAHGRDLAVRCAVWLGESGLDADRMARLGARLRLPSDCSELTILTLRERHAIAALNKPSAQLLLDLLDRCDALRRSSRFELLLQAVSELEPVPLEDQRRLLHDAARAIRQIDSAAVARQAQGAEIGPAIRAARLAALAKDLD